MNVGQMRLGRLAATMAALGALTYIGSSTSFRPVAPATSRPARAIALADNGPLVYLRSIPQGRVPYDVKEQVFLMAPDGTNRRLLIDGGGLYFTFTPSPDGTAIMFERLDSHFGPGHLVRIGADGSGLEVLNSCPSMDCVGGLAWSPDGRHVAIARGLDLMIMRPDGSDLRKVLTVDPNCGPAVSRADGCRALFGSPSWSPDGRHLALAWDRSDGHGGILVAGVDGTIERSLIECASDLCRRGARPAFPRWSPDGTEILFTWEFGLSLVHPDGTSRQRLISCPSGCSSNSPLWSPDGTMIAFEGPDGIYLMHRDGDLLGRVGPKGVALRAWLPGG